MNSYKLVSNAIPLANHYKSPSNSIAVYMDLARSILKNKIQISIPKPLQILLKQWYNIEITKVIDHTEKKIAKKIHDELANDLFLTMVTLERTKDIPTVLNKLDEIYQRTRNISRITSGYDKTICFGSELSSMLNEYASSKTIITTRISTTIDWSSVNDDIKINLYRIIQELMTNMKKHSEASRVALKIIQQKSKLHIHYYDNGKGVTIPSLVSNNGSLNMENRIDRLNGTLTLKSEIGKGYKAIINIPL